MADFKVIDNSKEYIEAVNKAADKILEEIGIEMERAAKKEIAATPKRIDTGLLRNSITYALDGGPAAISSYKADDGSKSGSYAGTMPSEPEGSSAVFIGTNVEYAIYVHEGTRRMTPNRFLRNALEKNETQIKAWIEKGLKEATANITTVSNDIG